MNLLVRRSSAGRWIEIGENFGILGLVVIKKLFVVWMVVVIQSCYLDIVRPVQKIAVRETLKRLKDFMAWIYIVFGIFCW